MSLQSSSILVCIFCLTPIEVHFCLQFLNKPFRKHFRIQLYLCLQLLYTLSVLSEELGFLFVANLDALYQLVTSLMLALLLQDVHD
jgi:hypothetical protein